MSDKLRSKVDRVLELIDEINSDTSVPSATTLDFLEEIKEQTQDFINAIVESGEGGGE